ncbi:tellurium resistance protein TerA [Paenibacillus riograndensis]|uniref:Tellurium resistance protein TerA n=1 Tax=Paenibacillus riograndensis TaxID=483937 RepID=A0A132U3M6_9BACL|nr:TerD family protein [Paenibacillus riograndensis]KWX78158.1 tellurium resistance protein TerA [Paenibacillus riograndensis]
MTLDLIKGQKCNLTKDDPLLTRIIVGMGWHNTRPEVEVDFSVFLLTPSQTVSKDEDLIFYGNPSTPNQSVAILQPEKKAYTELTDNTQIAVDLSQIPADYERIAFALTIYEGEKRLQNFSLLDDVYVRIVNAADGKELLRYRLGKNFSIETAIVVGEIYRYDNEWKFSAVGSGYAGGLAALCESYGIQVNNILPSIQPTSPVIQSQQSPFPLPELRSRPKADNLPPSSPASTPAPSLNLNTILLKNRGERISLQKGAESLGEILINLNWYQKKSSGWFGSKSIDLDLGCLFELKNGIKGSVQALGESFGSLNRPPYISLDGDDRTGSIATGENLRINGHYLSEISRIVIFAFIYEGITNWSEADAIVTIKQQGGPEIEVRLDEHNNNKGMCAIAMIRNQNDETFSVERLVEYFGGHQELDQYYHWNLRWEAGSK